MQWQTQAGNITTDIKVNVYFTLPAISTTNDVTWKRHVDDSAKGRKNMILGMDLITELGLNLKFSEHITEADDGTFNESTTPMVDLGTYLFKDLNTGDITPEESWSGPWFEPALPKTRETFGRGKLCVRPTRSSGFSRYRVMVDYQGVLLLANLFLVLAS